MASETNFSQGDLVFAKLKGYPHWPAIIKEKICNQTEQALKYKVEFFGDKTIAKITGNDLYPYLQNKALYGIPKTDNFKNKKFNTALKEAEEAFIKTMNDSLSNSPSNDVPTQNILGPMHDQTTTFYQIQNKIEDIHLKVQSIQDPDDLETSLTLAAEVGNALLAENSKLKQELFEATIKNSQLAQHISDKHNLLEIKYQVQFEELESEKESLIIRNAALTETLNEVEHQLNKERQLRSELMQSFEDQDREKEKIICTMEKEIKQLKNSMSKFNQEKSIKLDQVNDFKEVKDVQTQTYCRPDELPVQNHQLPFLLELAQLKTRQDQMEITMRVLQDQFQQHEQAKLTKYVEQGQPTVKRQHCQKPSSLNERKKPPHEREKSHFSVSLQIAKSKNPKKGLQDNKTDYNVTNTPNTGYMHQKTSTLDVNKISTYPTLKQLDTTGRIQRVRKPPTNAKPRAEGESLEEFYMKNIDFYIKFMTKYNKPCNMDSTETTSNSYSPLLPPSPPEPGKQFLIQADVHHNESFLDQTGPKNCKMKENLSNTILERTVAC